MLYYNKTTKEIVSEGNIVKKYNISLPRGTQFPPQDILDVLTIIPVQESSDKPAVTEFEELILEPENIYYEESTDTAIIPWKVQQVIFDDIDDNGTITKTKEEKLQEIKKQREQDEINRIEQEKLQEEERKKQELEMSWNNLRAQRNQLLLDSDKYVLPDYPHKTEEQRQAWLDYRQALRDITTNLDSPYNVVFPEKPL